MNLSDPIVRPVADDDNQLIDATLAALSAVRPRDGLEQRVLARIASAPALPWYHRLMPTPWVAAAASAVVIVAGAITATTYRHRPIAAPAPVAIHLPRPAEQPAAAAAGIGVSDHPAEPTKPKSRHRGVHRSYRAMHERVPLPRGTAAPLHPQPLPSPQ